jgi:biotin-dependent carboxylase-like uncharacterized protein
LSYLRIIEPGMFTTVQDLGRHGSSAIGVPPSGAADPLSLRVGNRLLGNNESAAALEYTLTGPTLQFSHDTTICITGGRCPKAMVGQGPAEREIAWCTPTRIRANETVRIGPIANGARGYLCIAGGINVPQVLGSRSTLATAAFGGFEGRALRPNDELLIAPSTSQVAPEQSVGDAAAWLATIIDRRTLRLVPSLHTEDFSSSAQNTLVSSKFTVADQSNRVGLRLEGPPIPAPFTKGQLQSEATTTGSIQVTGDDQLIVLGVDRPTTGGYPIIACVIQADLPILGIARPRDQLSFEMITREQARDLHQQQLRSLDAILPPNTSANESSGANP